ncbi:MAG: pyrimidine 5'-nucleotidase [Pelagimonas sp.]|jgi:putative hydrolase of the HAD superfamily|nr:pyrimidine 5'-nucleotidase [Pelagimonas sp.]
MPKTSFSHIRHWVFDLDNTLYAPSVRLFDQIEAKMTHYVMTALNVSRDQADHLRHAYWREHGTTLAGLMRNHDIDPDEYLRDVHDISFDALEKDPGLADLISALPGRKIVYTNGSAPYAAQVLRARGLEAAFDEIYGVEDADFHPKPDLAAFETVFGKDGLVPEQAAMFEDDLRNLAVPHQMGLRTVHVSDHPEPAEHAQFHTSDLSGFLDKLLY